MAERKVKAKVEPVQEVPIPIEQVPTVKPRRMPRKVANKTSLDDMIYQLQKAGYKITPASTSEDEAKQEESKVKLGLKKKVEPELPKGKLRLELGFTHSINGQQYGPGILELEPNQIDLYNTLIYQEGYSRQYYFETAANTPLRSYMIGQAASRGLMNYTKVEISSAQFDRIHLLPPTINVGKTDAAGYTSVNSNDTF